MQTKVNLLIMVEEQHLMEKVCGVARNVVIFGVDNASSSLTDNQKIAFIIRWRTNQGY